ncbi:zinc-binding alcohol dehydrogenase family protein, partial [Escherichia coli]|nr:zinc-binding alcohol dehydrogenase family protein [Escherichia coli]
EMLFDRLQLSVNGDADQTLLMLGGAGGVPCMAIQLARTLSRVNIIGTASRQESVRAVRGFGAHYVLDHSCALAPQVASLA